MIRGPKLTGPRAIFRETGAFGRTLLLCSLPFTATGALFWTIGAFVCPSAVRTAIATGKAKQNTNVVNRLINLLQWLNIRNGSLFRLNFLRSQSASKNRKLWLQLLIRLLPDLNPYAPCPNGRTSSHPEVLQVFLRNIWSLGDSNP